MEFLPEPFLLRGTLLRPLREKPQAAGVTAAGQRGGAEGSRVRSEVSTPVPQPSPAPCPAFPARKPLGFGSLKNQPPVSVGCGAWQQATRCVPPEPQAPVLQSGHGFLSPSISQQSSIFFIFYFFTNPLKFLLFSCLLANFLCHCCFFSTSNFLYCHFSRVSARAGGKNAWPIHRPKWESRKAI